jgi:MFS superfamily sulfate permease-like transporter
MDSCLSPRAVTLGLCLLFLTGLVQNLPKAVLAAIVLVAVKGLIGRIDRFTSVADVVEGFERAAA